MNNTLRAFLEVFGTMLGIALLASSVVWGTLYLCAEPDRFEEVRITIEAKGFKQLGDRRKSYYLTLKKGQDVSISKEQWDKVTWSHVAGISLKVRMRKSTYGQVEILEVLEVLGE